MQINLCRKEACHKLNFSSNNYIRTRPKTLISSAEIKYKPKVIQLIALLLFGFASPLMANVHLPSSLMEHTAKIDIRGTVLDENGQPLPGVSVLVKNSTVGSMTNTEGKFIITAAKGDVLVFSYIGYEKREIQVDDDTTVEVRLKAVSNALNEILVVSYGTQKSREVTGSIAQINASDVKDMPVGQFAQRLQGKIAGVQVNINTGKPGQGIGVRIRGAASISAGNTPLYVIDGQPITGNINNINPDEIENFTVLKDASATALYGSRAAN